MAGESELIFCTVCFGVLMTGAWFGWFWWVIHPHKSSAVVYGLVLVCLILSLFTFLGYPHLVVFVTGTLAFPFDLFLHAISPFCVISRWRSKEPASKCDHCRLCENCDSLVESSPLLVGTRRVLTRPVQEHAFYNQVELMRSADSCHLCNLLYHSIDGFRRHLLSSTAQCNPVNYKIPDAVNDETCPSSTSKAVSLKDKRASRSADGRSPQLKESREASDAATGELTVKLWMKRPFGKKALVRV